MHFEEQFIRFMSQVFVQENPDLSFNDDLDLLFYPNGKLKPLPNQFWLDKGFSYRRMFLHFKAQYFLPTLESIAIIQELIKDVDKSECLEIGAGNGWLGYLLGIRMTDSWAQAKPEIKILYEQSKQPTINYGSDVEKIDAVSAAKKYQPHTIIGSWITEKVRDGNPISVDEVEMMKNCKRYIFIGTEKQHDYKTLIRSWPSQKIKGNILSRAQNDDDNVIWIFENAK